MATIDELLRAEAINYAKPKEQEIPTFDLSSTMGNIYSGVGDFLIDAVKNSEPGLFVQGMLDAHPPGVAAPIKPQSPQARPPAVRASAPAPKPAAPPVAPSNPLQYSIGNEPLQTYKPGAGITGNMPQNPVMLPGTGQGDAPSFEDAVKPSGHGGTVSTLGIPGITNAASMTEDLATQVAQAELKQKLQYATLSPQERAELQASQKPEVGYVGMGMQLLQKKLEAEDRAEAALRRVASTKGKTPTPEEVQAARTEAGSRYAPILDFLEKAITSRYPTFPTGG